MSKMIWLIIGLLTIDQQTKLLDHLQRLAIIVTSFFFWKETTRISLHRIIGSIGDLARRDMASEIGRNRKVWK